MLTAIESLQRLREGNQRFASGEPLKTAMNDPARRLEVTAGQEPFAIVLGCSDSRVPAELVFDQGVGDLFVIRVAGNIVAPSQIGSVEFAAQAFGTKLVVVLGHSSCGAVRATLDQLEQPASEGSPNIYSIVDRIRPAVETLFETDLRNDPTALMHHSVRANVRNACDHLRHGSRTLEGLVQNHDLLVVGAEYSLESGQVNFFDGLPDEEKG